MVKTTPGNSWAEKFFDTVVAKNQSAEVLQANRSSLRARRKVGGGAQEICACNNKSECLSKSRANLRARRGHLSATAGYEGTANSKPEHN